MHSINEQRDALIALVEGPLKAAAEHARPATRNELLIFHALIDALVPLCIWCVPWSALHQNSHDEE